MSTTLSERELRVQAREEALTEIEEVIVAWWTYPYDSSLGEEGVPFEYMTGALHERYVEIQRTDTERNHRRFARGNDRVRVLDVAIEFDAGNAQAELCVASDHEVVDVGTGEVVGSDDGVPGTARVFLERIEEVWRISEFILSRAVGENVECEMTEQ